MSSDLCDPRAARRSARARIQEEAGTITTATRIEEKESLEAISVPVVDVAPRHKLLSSTEPVQHDRVWV